MTERCSEYVPESSGYPIGQIHKSQIFVLKRKIRLLNAVNEAPPKLYLKFSPSFELLYTLRLPGQILWIVSFQGYIASSIPPSLILG